MRSLHKSWQDKRPGWTRRIRWYDPDELVPPRDWGTASQALKIRLQVDERIIRPDNQEERVTYHGLFETKEEAQLWYDRYVNGMIGRTWWFMIKEAQEEA